MRISVLENDSGHKTWLAHGGKAVRWVVTLDGAEVQMCLTADEEQGEVLINEMDGRNRLKIDPTTGEPMQRWLRGVVVISKQELAPDGVSE